MGRDRDRAVPNLPARDLVVMSAFYARLGFEQAFRDDGWLIMRRGAVELEFFPAPETDPARSAARCSIRLSALDALCAAIIRAGVPVGRAGFPRLHEPRIEESGLRIAYLVDIDGNQLALIAEEDDDTVVEVTRTRR